LDEDIKIANNSANFSFEMWNCFEKVIKGIPRTKNSVGAWNK
jgi:hypothetical protein